MNDCWDCVWAKWWAPGRTEGPGVIASWCEPRGPHDRNPTTKEAIVRAWRTSWRPAKGNSDCPGHASVHAVLRLAAELEKSIQSLGGDSDP